MKATNHPTKPASILDQQGASLVCQSALEGALRQGAQTLLQVAIENEVAEYIQAHHHLCDDQGHRKVVRNGHLPERNLQTGIGNIPIRQPRIDDRRPDQRFTSAILPPYLRRVASLDNLIPALYLRGVSTSDMSAALEPILGENASGLSPANVVRLKEQWEKEREQWTKRDLSDKEYVYLWADGIYFNVRLSEDRPCVLVIVGSLPDGTKELVAISDGERESKLSWKNLLYGLKKRGLKIPPKLSIADGALGFWSALEEEYPTSKQQRCWVHKTANILDKLPKKAQPLAKERLQEIYMAETKKAALEAYDEFLKIYEAKYPKACACLKKDKDTLLTFYDFPAEHWRHIRTTNPIESTFATVRHRTRQTKGCGSRKATLSMVYKLGLEAEKGWRRLNGYQQLDKVVQGITFVDGIEQQAAA